MLDSAVSSCTSRKITRSPLQPDSLTRILSNLSPFSAAELSPYLQHLPERFFATALCELSEIGYVYSTDEPIYAAGAERQHDGSYRVWGFGTSRLPEIGILLTRHLRRDIMFPLFDQGATRLISTGLGGHPNIARWIKALGASVAYTTDLSGKDVAMYIWERP